MNDPFMFELKSLLLKRRKNFLINKYNFELKEVKLMVTLLMKNSNAKFTQKFTERFTNGLLFSWIEGLEISFYKLGTKKE